MSPMLSFWAKLGHEKWPDRYHPVACHLIDVAAVTFRLWERVFRRRLRKWLADQLGLDEETCRRWLAFWCGAHDLGKTAPCFQSQGKTDQLVTELKQLRFDFPVASKPHGDISTKVLADILETTSGLCPAVSKRVAQNIAVAVGGHHGIFPTNWDDMYGPLGNERWTAARSEQLSQLARLCGVTQLAPPSPVTPDDQSVWMCIAGLTSVADWIGSNQEFFHPAGNPQVASGSFDLDAYFDQAAGQATVALERLGWLGRAETSAPITFTGLFRSIKEPRPLQTALAQMVASMDEPRLLILEAPMGEGKTEAGWYAAASWDRQGGQGAYVALPTMATSNQMFDRVGQYLEWDAGKKNLMLLHGKAALNDHFEQLKYAAEMYDDERQPSAVVAEGWFAANKKHGLLAPYGVGTIDQALLAVLQTKHVFVRLFGLAGKCVILDEVHAYDAYMTTLMERLLRWLAALQCPVVLLSATLPAEKRLKLLRAYAGEAMPVPDAIKYPRLTSVTVGGSTNAQAVAADPARARTIGLGWLNEPNLVETLRQSLRDGGCAAVIRNTVAQAQDTYLGLWESMKKDGVTVELFHARFPFRRRMQIEEGVLRQFGKDGKPVDRDKRVLVATQVVEQSLDLDFDVMVSDVAPVDLVLQRAGRLHRHARGRRPVRVADPRVWLIEPELKAGLPTFGPSEYVYARFVLLRSYLALKAVIAVHLPDDLEHFIEQVYGNEPLSVPEGWLQPLHESEQKLREKQASQELDALDVVISDHDQSPLEQQSQQLEEDDPEAAKRIQAQTRDTGPTIHLVVIYHLGDREYLDSAALEPFDETDIPDIKRVRSLLANEVTINHGACVAYYAGRSVPNAWRKKGMLRHHRIVRVDATGRSLPAEYPLRVDDALGIRLD